MNAITQKMTADIWISLLIGAGFLITALYIAFARPHRPTRWLRLTLLFFCSELGFAYALQMLSTDFAARAFWYKMVHFGFTITPTAFFCLSLQSSGKGHWLTRRKGLIFSLFPAITTMLIFTNEMHGLVWNLEFTREAIAHSIFLAANYAGPWYWVAFVYAYLMMGTGLISLSWLVAQSRKMYWWQSGVILCAGILSMLGTRLDVMGIRLLPSFSSTALGFAVGAIIVALMLLHTRGHDLVSVSRNTIMDSIDDSIIVVDVNNQIVYLNPAAERLFGQPAAQAIGKPINQFLPDQNLFCDTLAENAGEVTLDTSPMRSTFDMRVSAIKDWRGFIVSKVIVLRDITERKRAQEDMRRATEGAHAIFWRAVVTQDQDRTAQRAAGGYIWDTHYFNLEMVNEFIPLQSHPSNRFPDRFYFSRVEEDRIRMDQHSAEALRRGDDGYAQEFRLRDSNGVIHWMYEDARILRLNDTQCEVNGFITDITERKAIEEALRESETRLSIFFKNDPTGKIIVNRATRIIHDANPSALELIGASKEDVIGKQCHGLICPADVGQCSICDLGQTMDRSERELITKDGGRVPILKTVVPIKMNGEDYLLESFIDVTSQKKAEEKILASIEEKEALLKEIHHRVKNNMQIISSLMNLQANRIKDENTIEVFRESQSRVRSMALIHEKLYRSENLAHIRFDEYLRELTTSLLRMYNDPLRTVRLEIKADPVHLDIDTAIPCGLIVNELVTNSLKHGLRVSPTGELNHEGVISIQLSLVPEHEIRLLIADNGSGFPDGVDFLRVGTLGLQLVTSLTYQLDGEVNFSNQDGAQVEVLFTSKSAYIQ